MDNKKTLKSEYKERKIIGAVFRVVNTKNGMYLLDYTPDLRAKQNAFNFIISIDSCFHYKLQKDWMEFGGKAFNFEILETLEKKKEQTHNDFIDDLKTLEQFWGEKLDPLKRY